MQVRDWSDQVWKEMEILAEICEESEDICILLLHHVIDAMQNLQGIHQVLLILLFVSEAIDAWKTY